jgi:hypothetical protein
MKLTRLIDRALGRAAVLEPRKSSIFEPPHDAAAPSVTSLFAKLDHDEQPARAALEPERPRERTRPEREGSASPRRAEPVSAPSLEVASPRPTARESASVAAPVAAAALGSSRREVEAPRAPVARDRPPPAPLPLATITPGAARPIAPGTQAKQPAPAPSAPLTNSAERDRSQAPDESAKARPPRRLERGLTTPVARHDTRISAPAPLVNATRGETRRRAPERERAAEPAPRIHVTIGRVEVRAVSASGGTPRPSPRRAESSFTLQDYLQQRERR